MRYRPNKRAIIIDHVGNYARFGLPDDDREWSLDTKKPPEPSLLTQCKSCYDTFRIPPPEEIATCQQKCNDCPSFLQMAIGNASSNCPKKSAAKVKCPVLNNKIVTICPSCGHIHWSGEEYKPKQVEQKSGELVKITGFKLILKTPDDCHTYQDLLDYAKSKGYKPGWAYYQAKKRGLIA